LKQGLLQSHCKRADGPKVCRLLRRFRPLLGSHCEMTAERRAEYVAGKPNEELFRLLIDTIPGNAFGIPRLHERLGICRALLLHPFPGLMRGGPKMSPDPQASDPDPSRPVQESESFVSSRWVFLHPLSHRASPETKLLQEILAVDGLKVAKPNVTEEVCENLPFGSGVRRHAPADAIVIHEVSVLYWPDRPLSYSPDQENDEGRQRCLVIALEDSHKLLSGDQRSYAGCLEATDQLCWDP
jgi:hypothetical protein